MTENVQVITRGISLYPQDWSAIDQFAKDSGLNRSAAIRMILRRWLDFERQRPYFSEENLIPERAVNYDAE